MSFAVWSGGQLEAFLQEHLSVSFQILPPLVNTDELYMKSNFKPSHLTAGKFCKHLTTHFISTVLKVMRALVKTE